MSQGPSAEQLAPPNAGDWSLADMVDAAAAAADATTVSADDAFSPYCAAHDSASFCQAELRNAEDNEESCFVRYQGLARECREAEGQATHLAAMQLLQANTNVDERPTQQEAEDPAVIAGLMQFADAAVVVMAWHTFTCCKPGMAGLQLGGLEVAERFQGRALLLLCCWTASKFAAATGDVLACADVVAAVRAACMDKRITESESVHPSKIDVVRVERAMLKVLVNQALPSYGSYLQRLGLVPASAEVLKKRCASFGKGWYLCA